jgi:hypothetical protein
MVQDCQLRLEWLLNLKKRQKEEKKEEEAGHVANNFLAVS